MNIYAPTQPAERLTFYESFLLLPSVDSMAEDSWILLGDFNISLQQGSSINHLKIKPWYDWLQTHFCNNFDNTAPTFNRGSANSTIDYIYHHHSLAPRVSNAQQLFLPTSWTDHCLLTVDLLGNRQDVGPGAWRFNPTLLSDKEFVALIEQTVSLFFNSLPNDFSLPSASYNTHKQQCSPQDHWERFKLLLQQTAKRYSHGSRARFQNKIDKLQQARLQTQDEETCQRLQTLIDERIRADTHQSMLRSATRWHENGERNNKYFYRVIRERQAQQTIQSLRCSSTGSTLTTVGDIITEARNFYQKLYTPDAIDVDEVNRLLDTIPNETKISKQQAAALISAPTEIDLIALLSHSPAGKSPGMDGIPFEVYKYLASNSKPFLDLFHRIVLDAFQGIFPPSWQQTRMVLLFKKGDPQLLSNWRPLSLINTDAKIFTKLLANRFNKLLPQLINPYQTGFLPNRLISDNGWWNQVLMENLRDAAPELPQVAVLLDQEKAYDRVHPEYLQRVLARFGFPDTLIVALTGLFFDTRISVSINGWLGSPIKQLRGLRQGDPLSPLLFNLAFEPLLRSILACPSLSGVSLAPVPLKSSVRCSPRPLDLSRSDLPLPPSTLGSSPPPVKLLSYADDLEVFLSHPNEWPDLLQLLDQYGKASNAKVNLGKTVLLSLSGVSHDTWISIARSSDLTWHDASVKTAVRYLGYPLYHTRHQLLSYLNELKLKIIRQCHFLKERHLSIKGSGLVANSLILSTLWHILRVTPVPNTWLSEVRSIIRKFLLPFWPAPSWSKLCLPQKYGGVGLVDIEDQSLALHLIYLQRLLGRHRPSEFVSPWLVRALQLYTGHTSILPIMLYPDRYRSLVSRSPLLGRMMTLICRLPSFDLSPGWPVRWFLDLPLSAILTSIHPASGRPSTVALSTLSLRYLLSDLFSWEQTRNTLVLRILRSTKLKAIARELFPSAGPSEATLQLPTFFCCYLNTPEQGAYSPVLFSPRDSDWLPSSSHWLLRPRYGKSIAIRSVPLQAIRRNWNKLLEDIPQTIHPPLRLPAEIILSSVWKTFWALPLPQAAITPWWRLLHNSIGVASKLFRWNPTSFPSPLCRFCTEVEDTFHFVVGCPTKWVFWSAALAEMNLAACFKTSEDVWTALVTFQDTADNLQIDTTTMCQLGFIFLAVWKQHWRCVFDDTPWSLSAALALLQQNRHLVLPDLE